MKMKREEHYCDRCGTQMSRLDADGENNVYGLFLKGFRPEAAATSNIRLIIDTNTETPSGSSSRRFEMLGTEFCSVDCFSKSMIKLLSSINPDLVIA
jgi:hypothetical protein